MSEEGFSFSDEKNRQVLDDLDAWVKEHRLTVYQLMDFFSGLMASMAVESGDPEHFMSDLIRLLVTHLSHIQRTRNERDEERGSGQANI